MITPAATFQQEGIIGAGLTLHFDANDRASYKGNGARVKDLIGSNNGEFGNGTTFNSNGYFTFDGTDDYVTTTFDFTGLTKLSVEAWAYQNSQGSFNTILGQWKDNDFAASSLVLETVGSEMWFIIANGTNLYSAKKTGYSTGAWHHVVGTWDNSTVRVYVDGVIGGTTASTSDMNDSSLPTLLGGIQTPGGGYTSGDWNGDIAIARFYNRTLSLVEITHNFNAQRHRFGR